jgi:hypothetical protein
VPRVRSRASILTVSLVLASASGFGTQAFAQSADEAACELEQRSAPWRAACHTPLHFAAALPAILEASRDGPSLAATLSMFGRSTFPSDRDNGAVWSGRGLSIQMAFGVGGAFGPFRYSMFPSVQWGQNLDFAVADTTVGDHSSHIYPWEGPGIDWPQRMGSVAFRGMSPGQSFLEVVGWSQAVVGVSTENIWWGPSNRYPMLLGATSEGFPHAFGRSPTVTLASLRLVARAVLGQLTESEYFDQDGTNDHNLLSALRLEVGFGSLPGAQIAVTSIVRQPWGPQISFTDVLGRLLPRATTQGRHGDDQADGFGAVTFVLPVASLGMRLHGTWGRGDFFQDAEDLLTEPEHNQFWAVGLHQGWQRAKDGPRWSLSTEHASSGASPSQLGPHRNPTSLTVYRHADQGHSQRGQLLGPSIGPGSRATYASLERASDSRYIGMLVERILWDIDAFRRSVPNVPRNGQDREWLFGGRFGTKFNISGVPSLRLDAFGGASIRWNRQYVRFTGDLLDYPERETNFWLDLRLAWTPDRDEARQ